MKKIITIAIVVLAMNAFGQTSTWQWAKSATGSITPYTSVTDNNENYYVAGWFTDSIITIDTFNLINPNPCCYNTDMLIVKYNSMGDEIWVKGFSSGKGSPVSITIDNNGFLFIIGTFSSSILTIDGITISNTSVGYNDIFLAKMDTLGNVIWLRGIGGTSDESAIGISADSSYIYLFGKLGSSPVNFGSTTLVGGGSFIAKYTPSGACSWAKIIGTTGGFYNGLRDVEPDGNGCIYATGNFGNTSITFDAITLLNSGMWYSNDMYIVKYSASGNALWAKSYYCGFGNDESGSKIVIGNNGNLYVLGYFDAEINLGSITLQNPLYTGSPSMFIAKFDSIGNSVWGYSNHSKGWDLAKDSYENIYLTGNLSDTILSFGSYTLTKSTTGNSYLVKYDSSGSVQSAEGVGGGGNIATPYSISLSINENVFVSGSFTSPSLILGSTALANPGTQSMFAAKYGTQITTTIEVFQEEHSITIAPNPITSQATISFLEEQNKSTIKIFDITGKEIRTINFSGRQLTFYRGTMENGLYFFQATDEKNHVTNKKIIIQ